MHDVTLIIPQYGHSELTRDCLKTLRTHAPSIPRVIVVDDGSLDDSVLSLRDHFADTITLLEQPHQGITAAWNRGIAAAETEFVILLNNDVLTHGDWITPLLAPLQQTAAALTGVEWRIEFSLPRTVLSRLGGERFLAGWCLAFPRATWERLGGFDDALRLYFSDTDFQGRLRTTTEGLDELRLRSVENLPLTHLGHRTAHARPCASNSRARWHQDRQRMLRKWGLESPTSSSRK